MDLLRPDLAERLAQVPEDPGCYLYKDGEGRVLYVGKAKNLRRRVLSYFQAGSIRELRLTPRLRRLVRELAVIETIATGSEVEALLLENRLIKEHQPRDNVRLKDGKDFPLLAITREEFPRVFVTRDRSLADTEFVGPFTSATELYRAYHFLQRTFRFRVCDLDLHEDDPGRRHFRPCLNLHIKRCSAPCTPRIGFAEYAGDIAALRAFLSGRGTGPVVEDLRRRMLAASKELRFEDAARMRDQLQSLDRLKSRGRLRDWAEPGAPTLDIHSGLEGLRAALGLVGPPKIIEGFDIAHLQGTHVVAALVRFNGGVPDKDGYRRFKVKGGVDGPVNDDFAAMREVVGRRYRRLRDEGLPLPDLVLIDGGAGQVAQAVAALAELGVTVPGLIGLAKREETIIRADGSPVRLSKRDPALKMLQYVRDEAHRFCRRYFHLLQRKAVQDGSLPETAP
ncbi:UvrABC system protein C [Planctomycetota bacterium]|nr:UvrABC system protein C [Planctomycetota bacterium]